MISNQKLAVIINFFRGHDATRGCFIVFHGNNSSRVLFEGDPTTREFRETVILVEEIEHPQGFQVERRELPPERGGTTHIPSFVTNSSQVGSELTGAAISCGLLAWGTSQMVGGAVVAAPTGGASTIIIAAGWVGVAASGFDCGLSLYRLILIASNPDGNTLDRIDHQEWYNQLNFWVDSIGLAANIVGIPAMYRLLRSARSGLTMSFEELRALNQYQRRQVVREAIERLRRSGLSIETIRQALRGTEHFGREALETTISSAPRVGVTVAGATNALSRMQASFVSRGSLFREAFASAATIDNGIGIVANSLPQNYTGVASGAIYNCFFAENRSQCYILPNNNTPNGQTQGSLIPVSNTIIIHFIDVATQQPRRESWQLE